MPRKTLAIVALTIAFAAALHAQQVGPGGVPGANSGAGAVSSVFGRTGAVAATTGDYTAAQVTNAAATNAANTYGGVNTFPGGDLFLGGVNAQTGTTYAFVASDENKVVTFSNASAVAVTLSQATTTGFTSGFYMEVLNLGVGTVTITPATSTINGAATLTLATGQSAVIWSNGTNYIATGAYAALTNAANSFGANSQTIAEAGGTTLGWVVTTTSGGETSTYGTNNAGAYISNSSGFTLAGTSAGQQILGSGRYGWNGLTTSLASPSNGIVNCGNNYYGNNTDTTCTVQAAVYATKGTAFTVPTGCGTVTVGTGSGSTAGSFTGGSATCNPAITFGKAVPTGEACFLQDITTPAAIFERTSALSTTGVTFTNSSGTPGATDIYAFGCPGIW